MLDDIDGPKFLRGAEEEFQEDSKELDAINVSLLLQGKAGYERETPCRLYSQGNLLKATLHVVPSSRADYMENNNSYNNNNNNNNKYFIY